MLASTSLRRVLRHRAVHETTRRLATANLAASDLTGASYEDSEAVYKAVQEYYGQVLTTSGDLKTNACTTSGAPPQAVRDALARVPREITEKYYGCGTPLPMGITGLDVLDLGSGSGQDCYIAANLVGDEGSVTGVDMTAEQLAVAREHAQDYCTQELGYASANLDFKEGMIEFLGDAGVAPASKDLVISNCVINLSPDKERVIQGVHDVLREGGELHFSDVYCDRRLPLEVRSHELLYGECLAGALYIEDFKRICHKVGFADPRQLKIDPISVTDPELAEICGNAKFYSITYRCFKLDSLESLCEDFGQVAFYKGTIPHHSTEYALDDHHIFEKGRPMLVCGNTAAMVSETWLAPHFTVVGDTSTHYGLFDCAPPMPAAGQAAEGSADAGGALLGGGCC